MTKHHDHADIMLRVNPEVAKALKANNGKLITEMEDLTRQDRSGEERSRRCTRRSSIFTRAVSRQLSAFRKTGNQPVFRSDN